MNKKGFTLIELIIGIVIVAILATTAIPVYGRFVEKMRAAEVDMLAGPVLAAQVRVKLRTGHFTRYWHQLDNAPMPLRFPREHNDYANSLLNTIFYTKGGITAPDGPYDGYAVWFEEDALGTWFMVAQRVGKDASYSYCLILPFESPQHFCIPKEGNEKDLRFCLEYMGLDDPQALPPNPIQKEKPESSETDGSENTEI